MNVANYYCVCIVVCKANTCISLVLFLVLCRISLGMEYNCCAKNAKTNVNSGPEFSFNSNLSLYGEVVIKKS
jgi:hypothetical protein